MTNITDKSLDTIWYTRCPTPTPLGLAAKLGWFEDEFGAEGIAIKSLKEAGNPAERESHYDHHLTNSFRQGGNVPAIWAKSLGRNTRVIGLNWITEFQGILARRESGILSPKDLRGRRLGLPRHGNSIDFGRAGALRGLVTALELGGIGEAEVEWIDIASGRENSDARTAALGFPFNQRGGGGYGSQLQALIRGEVDAIYVKGAGGAQLAHQLDTQIVLDIAQHPDKVVRANNGAPRPVTVDQEFLDAHPDLSARFLARVVEIGQWAEGHKAEAIAYISRETGSAEAWVRYAYGEDVNEHLKTDLEESSIAALEAFKDFLFARGFLKQDFSVREWINPEPLNWLRSYARKDTASPTLRVVV